MKRSLKSKIALFTSVLSCVGAMQGVFANRIHDDIEFSDRAFFVKCDLDRHPEWLDEQENGIRPITLAIQKGQLDAVDFLISEGANVNVVDGDRVTPLEAAVKKDDIDNSIVQLLLENGADVNARNNDGQTVLDYANRRVIDAEQSGKAGAKTLDQSRALVDILQRYASGGSIKNKQRKTPIKAAGDSLQSDWTGASGSVQSNVNHATPTLLDVFSALVHIGRYF